MRTNKTPLKSIGFYYIVILIYDCTKLIETCLNATNTFAGTLIYHQNHNLVPLFQLISNVNALELIASKRKDEKETSALS